MRDPFYQQICEALGNEDLHPSLFEACAVDLLRDVYPGLVPVRGGSDSGFDGAVADGQGEAFPLVCTTEDDVIGNLTKSLDSNLAHGFPRRKVVLATSQALTPPRRRNLIERAREKGFTLVQIHDREDFTQRLYRNVHWCKDLLALSGAPAALSLVPPGRRPLLDLEPIGREQDIDWLLGTEGDRVLTGEPGSGKTFLLRHLMLQREDWPGLFLCSSDENEIANAIRTQEPEFVVVVDDAHLDPGRLVRLRRLRNEIVAEFSILATTWNGGADGVVEALGVSNRQVHKLELLTRDQIVELYRQAGVEVRDGILRSLVDQAANKPGLAATIAHLWMQGGWQEVLNGTALSRNLLALFRDLVGNDCASLLAAFSLGGEKGMSCDAVGTFLEIGRADLQDRVAALAAGGVLSEGGRGVLRVRPYQLRSALLWQVFFRAPRSLDYRDLLPQAKDLSSAVEALVLAKDLGAPVPAEEIHALVLQAGSPLAWEILARHSATDARWVLQRYPGDLLTIAAAALHAAPEDVLPRLLHQAETALGVPESLPSHPLRILDDWIKDLHSEDELVSRRKKTAQAIHGYLASGGEGGIGIASLCLVLSPEIRGVSRDPGFGDKFTLAHGLLRTESLRELERIWDNKRALVRQIDAVSWPYISRLLWDWIHPENAARGQRVPDETASFMRRFAERLLRDLSEVARASPGVTSALQEMAARIDLKLDVQTDPVFDLLYPKPGVTGMGNPRVGAEITALAAKWLRAEPERIAEELVRYAREGRNVGRFWSQSALDLCHRMSAAADSPEVWFDAFLSAELPGCLGACFLREVQQRRRPGWEELVRRGLASQGLRDEAAALIAALPDPPPDLVEPALSHLAANPSLVERVTMARQASLSFLRALLTHSQWPVAFAAAFGEWWSDPDRKVRQEILREWRSAVLRARPGTEPEELRIGQDLEFGLGEILQTDAELSLNWLRARLSDSPPHWQLCDSDLLQKAVSVLDREQRRGLLEELSPAAPQLHEILPQLVGGDLDLYQKLLAREDLRYGHLSPLEGTSGNTWASLAEAAAAAGFTAEDIARATLSGWDRSGWGPRSRALSEQDQAFAALEEDPAELIREIGRAGRRLLKDPLEKARQHEQWQALEGL